MQADSVGFAHVKELGRNWDDRFQAERTIVAAREEYGQSPDEGEQTASQLRHFVRAVESE